MKTAAVCSLLVLTGCTSGHARVDRGGPDAGAEPSGVTDTNNNASVEPSAPAGTYHLPGAVNITFSGGEFRWVGLACDTLVECEGDVTVNDGLVTIETRTDQHCQWVELLRIGSLTVHSVEGGALVIGAHTWEPGARCLDCEDLPVENANAVNLGGGRIVECACPPNSNCSG